MTEAGQQQPAFVELPGIFGIKAVQGAGGVEFGQGGIRAEPLTMCRILDAHAGTAAIGGVVDVPEADPGRLPAQHGAMAAVLQAGLKAVAGLRELMLDVQVIATVDAMGGGIQRIAFDVHPAALGFEVIQLVAQAQAIIDLPFDAGAQTRVGVADHGVVGVVVLAAQFRQDAAVVMRRAPVAFRAIDAVIGRQVHAQIAARLQAQPAHQLGFPGLAEVAVTIDIGAVGVDPVAGNLAQPAGGADPEALDAIGADGGHGFLAGGPARFLADGVDRCPHRTAAKDHRGRAMQHFDALIAPGAARIVLRAGTGLDPDAVLGNADRVGAGVAACGEGQAPRPAGADVGDPGGAGDPLADLEVAALLHLQGIDRADCGWQFARRDARAAAGRRGLIEMQAGGVAMSADLDGRQRGLGKNRQARGQGDGGRQAVGCEQGVGQGVRHGLSSKGPSARAKMIGDDLWSTHRCHPPHPRRRSIAYAVPMARTARMQQAGLRACQSCRIAFPRHPRASVRTPRHVAVAGESSIHRDAAALAYRCGGSRGIATPRGRAPHSRFTRFVAKTGT